MPLPASCRLQDLCHGMLCICVCVMHWRVVNFYLVPNPCFCSYLASPSISFACQIWISNLNPKVLSKRWVGIYRCIWRRKSFLVRDPPALTKLALLKNGGRWQEIEKRCMGQIISIERIFQKGWSGDFPRRRWEGKDICSHDEGDDELGGLVAERALLVSSFRLNMRMLGRC